jgi:hypothetical protein
MAVAAMVSLTNSGGCDCTCRCRLCSGGWCRCHHPAAVVDSGGGGGIGPHLPISINIPQKFVADQSEPVTAKLNIKNIPCECIFESSFVGVRKLIFRPLPFCDI